MFKGCEDCCNNKNGICQLCGEEFPIKEVISCEWKDKKAKDFCVRKTDLRKEFQDCIEYDLTDKILYYTEKLHTLANMDYLTIKAMCVHDVKELIDTILEPYFKEEEEREEN